MAHPVTASVPQNIGYGAPNSLSSATSKPHLLKQNTTIGLTSPEDNDTKSLASLQMRFECAVCYEMYSESGPHAPRNLLCGHTFCTGCLIQLVKDDKISCPKCHHNTPAPRGVNDLVKNYGVLEIMYSHPTLFKKKDVNGSHSSKSAPNTSSLIPDSHTSSNVPICSEHGDRMSSYCEEDKVLVCSSCLLYGPHKQHQSKLVTEIAYNWRQTLVKLTPDIGEMINSAERSIEDIETVKENISASSHELSNQIDTHFKELINVIEQRKKELKVEVLHRSQSRIEALMEQKEAISLRITTAQRCHAKCTQLLASKDTYEIVNGYPEAIESVKQVFIKLPSMDPIGRNDLVVDFPPDMINELDSQFNKYGNVRSGVGIVKYIYCEPFHDGVRIYWQGHNYVDSIGITYALQMASGEEDQRFVNIYRGGNTKFTWNCDHQQHAQKDVYYFRVRVQTCEGVGNWSETVKCTKTPPAWKWHIKRRNLKIELDKFNMEASSRHSSGKDYASVAGDTILTEGQHYMEIEIKEVAKHNIRRDWFTKFAVGVVQCEEETAKNVPWHDCKELVGQLRSYKSWGYLANSGIKVYNYPSVIDEEYGGISTIEVGDRLGMLVDFTLQGASISFFFNGQDLGVAFTNIRGPLLPVLSVCDRFNIRLRFPPPPYSKRNPRLTLLPNGGSALC